MGKYSGENFNMEEENFEEECQAIIDAIKRQVEKDMENGVVYQDAPDVPMKVALMEAACKILRNITTGENVQIVYNLEKSPLTRGVISVEGRSVRFTNTVWLAKVFDFTYSVDSSPLTNGRVQIDFCFV